MTAIEVKLPELGDGIKSGDILDVLVREGDSITKDQTICEIETDKATVEIPSSHSGKVVKIHIQSGQSIPIGATLVTLEATSGAVPAAPAAAPTPATPPPAPPTPAVAERPAPAPVAPTPAAPVAPPAPTAARPVAPAVAEPQPVVAAPAAAISALSVTPAGPAIRRLAREVGIDLSHVAGTGPGGRITREDVLAAVRRSSAGTVSTPTTPPPAVRAPSNAAVDASPEIAPAAPLTTGATNDEWGPIQIDRMTKIRKTIVTRMHDSWSTVPRVTNFDDADITELERIRQASKPDYESRGIKLTTMPFLIKAVALALKSNPAINAAIDDLQEQIIYKQYVNIGIAVDTPRGLVVPVLRRPDQLSIPDVARSLATIAENARNNDFKIEDLRGGTFSISNLGAVGGTYSTPIVNIPEVAILLVGRARKMPVVVNEQTDQVAVRLMMPLSLSYDHRLVDGATAARFLNEVIAYLENPSRLLIAP